MPIELDGDTRATTNPPPSSAAPAPVPVLTILAHPDPSRIGERLVLRPLVIGQEVLLSRAEPVFERIPGAERRFDADRPLGGRYLSRQPLRLRPADGSEQAPGSLVLDLSTTRTKVEVDGVAVEGEVVLPVERVQAGVVLLLARKIVLLLHQATLSLSHDAVLPSLGLVGDGSGMANLRREIRRLAGLDVSVLLRGESGTGKELAARALHEESGRRSGPFVAVNMGSLAPSLAAAALFGAERGAYTGADRNRRGHFRAAQGGTLFLDEIGEAPPEVQVMLLRTLETGEVQPVGSSDTFKVDARVIAATDTRLEDAMASDRFKAPLYHRLAGYTIYLPALRERREDLGQLLYFFLRRELAELGRPMAEETNPEGPWPPAEWVARLAVHPWPGNVRELRNVARRLAISGRDGSPDLDRLLDSLQAPPAPGFPLPGVPLPGPAVSAPAAPAPAKRRTLRKLEDVDEDELLAALREHRWHVQKTAAALGISRPNLYRLMDASPSVRVAGELEADEIQAAVEAADGDLDAAALGLEVSTLGLKRRMKVLGLDLG